jgi:3-hydroxyacyl-[acyl-carrier-protein] dehydratase
VIDRDGLQRILPHRPPMLLVDAIVEIEPGRRAVGVHRVTDEDCAGHFPGHPVMPGVKIAEALAQVAAVIFLGDAPQNQGKPVYLAGLDRFRFRRPVRPGEELRLEVRVEQARHAVIRFVAEATVGGRRVANGQILAAGAPAPSDVAG